MVPELRDLFEGAARVPDSLPSPTETWAAGRARRRARLVGTGTAVVLLVLGVLAADRLWLPDQPTVPEVVDTRPSVPSPTPAAGTTIGLDDLGVASSTYLAGDGVWERRSPDGLRRHAGPGPSNAFLARGLPDGTVVWDDQQGGVWALAPDADTARALVTLDPDVPGHRLRLAGSGDLDGDPVVLVDEAVVLGKAEDRGGTLWAYRLDGTREVLMTYPSAWESSLSASLVRGWLLTTYYDENYEDGQIVLTAPDGTEEVVRRSVGPGTPRHDLGALGHPTGAFLVRSSPVLSQVTFERLETAIRPDVFPNIQIPSEYRNVHASLLTMHGDHLWARQHDAPETLFEVELTTGTVRPVAARGVVLLHTGLSLAPR